VCVCVCVCVSCVCVWVGEVGCVYWLFLMRDVRDVHDREKCHGENGHPSLTGVGVASVLSRGQIC
jgi:hypothetical protein